MGLMQPIGSRTGWLAPISYGALSGALAKEPRDEPGRAEEQDDVSYLASGGRRARLMTERIS